jgi:ribosome-associated toxin RatA of RatAB toxin-antitoxin module
MADQTESCITVAAEPAAVMAVIGDFESYPAWTGSVKEVEVVARDGQGRPEQVRYVLDAGAIKDDYTLRYDWRSPTELRWSLVRGSILKTLDGVYELRATGQGGTDVHYRLTVDVSIPMIGMIKRKAEKVIIDTALKELKKRVEG